MVDVTPHEKKNIMLDPGGGRGDPGANPGSSIICFFFMRRNIHNFFFFFPPNKFTPIYFLFACPEEISNIYPA